MSEDVRYEAALRAALAVIRTLTCSPALPGYERLASVTFIILDAFYEAEALLAARGDDGGSIRN